MKHPLRQVPWLAAAVGFVLVAASTPARASSHMDAPLIILDDAANTTDVYAFLSSAHGQKYLTTALAVYPHEEPGVGPNKYNFDDEVLYQIHVATGADVAAGRATHASSAQGQTFSDPDVRVERVPVTLPITDIVQRLNALDPTTVRGYPSALDQLGLEARAGRLRIQPMRLRCIGEPLLPEVRERLERTWNAPVHSQWVASEAGTLGYSCPGGRGMHLNDDLTIVEPVDVDGNPVAPGTRSAKV